jgi:DNA gyrase subunit B/topoisomerase-4 subunit B
MKLIPVGVNTISEIRHTLEFFMGKNTPERKQFIMENLVNEEALDQELLTVRQGE